MTFARKAGIGGFWLAASVLTLSTLAPVRADEIFVCDDQSVLYINSKNRAAMSEHPCVKGWFERNRAANTYRRPTAASAVPMTEAVPAVADASAATGAAPVAEPAAPAAAASTEGTEDKAANTATDEKKPTTIKAGRRSF